MAGKPFEYDDMQMKITVEPFLHLMPLIINGTFRCRYDDVLKITGLD